MAYLDQMILLGIWVGMEEDRSEEGTDPMKRRNIQLILLQMATAAMFVSVLMALIRGHEFGDVARILVAWLLVLAILAVVCYRSVPIPLRTRPEPPPEYFEIRPGSVTPRGSALLAEAVILNDRCYCKQQHVLYRLKRCFPEGVWYCLAEEAAGEIVAWEMKFESAASPLLDRSRAAGEGRLILVPSNLPH